MDSDELFFESILLVVFFEDRAKVVEVASAPFVFEDDSIVLIYSRDQAFVMIFPHEFVQAILVLNLSFDKFFRIKQYYKIKNFPFSFFLGLLGHRFLAFEEVEHLIFPKNK
mgnify:CR=1 FL=1